MQVGGAEAPSLCAASGSVDLEDSSKKRQEVHAALASWLVGASQHSSLKQAANCSFALGMMLAASCALGRMCCSELNWDSTGKSQSENSSEFAPLSRKRSARFV